MLGELALQRRDLLRSLVDGRAALVGSDAGRLQLALQGLQPRCQVLRLAARRVAHLARRLDLVAQRRPMALHLGRIEAALGVGAGLPESRGGGLQLRGQIAGRIGGAAKLLQLAVGGRRGGAGLLQLALQRGGPLGVPGVGGARRPRLELQLQLEQRLLEDRDPALGRLGIEPLRRGGGDLLGRQHGGARLGQLALQLHHPLLVRALLRLRRRLLEGCAQLDDLALQGLPASVGLRAAILERCDLLLQLPGTTLQLLGLACLVLQPGDARLHVLGIDLARGLGPQIGEHALQLGPALVGPRGRLSQPRDRRLALLHLRLQGFQLGLQVGCDVLVVRVAVAAGVAEHPLQLGDPSPLPVDGLQQLADALLVLGQLRLELADAGDGLGVDG